MAERAPATVVEPAPPPPAPPPPDPRCERLRRENERQIRELQASLSGEPESETLDLVKRLSGALAPCLPGRQAAWGLSFAWPRPRMGAIDVFPPRGMDPAAWVEPLLLQVVRATDDGELQRACASVGVAGPRACPKAVSGRSSRIDRAAMPVLVSEQTFHLDRVVDIDGDEELIVHQGFCTYECYDWFEIWSSAKGRLVPYGETARMNIVAVDDFDGDGMVDVATRAGFARICHERDDKDPVSKEVRVRDECFGPDKASPALVRTNLGGGHFAAPSTEVEADASGRPDPRGFRY